MADLDAKIAEERRLGIFLQITPTEHLIRCDRFNQVVELAEAWEQTAQVWEGVADDWRVIAHGVERWADRLWTALCLLLPVALVVGAVLGHFTWGAS